MGGGKLLCIITMVLWHVRVSSRLLGLSDDETAPLGPPVPRLCDSLKALLLHTLWGGWKLFLRLPFFALVMWISHPRSTAWGAFVCGWIKGNSWASQTMQWGKPSQTFLANDQKSKESVQLKSQCGKEALLQRWLVKYLLQTTQGQPA